jgi:hypothetical protein
LGKAGPPPPKEASVIALFLIINVVAIVVVWQAVTRTRFQNAGEKQEAERRQSASREISELQDSAAASISEELLRREGIEVTEEIAPSMHTRVVVVGTRNDRLLAVQNAKWIPGMIQF